MPAHHDRFDKAMSEHPDLHSELQAMIRQFASDKKKEYTSAEMAAHISSTWDRVVEFTQLFPSKDPRGETHRMIGVGIYQTLHGDGWSMRKTYHGSRELKVYHWEEKDEADDS